METSTYYFLFMLFLCSLLMMNQIIKKHQNLPPSPPLCLPIFGHLHLLKKPVHRTLTHLSDKYGPILLLYFGSRPVLLVSNPSLVEECFTKNDIIFSNKPPFLSGKYFGYNFTTMTWAPYGEHWRNLRRLASLEVISSKRIQMFANIRNQEVCLLIRRLLKPKDGAIEMKSTFFQLATNMIMGTLAGKRYYFDDDDDVGKQSREEAKRFQQIVKESFEVIGTVNTADFVPLYKWIGAQKKFEKKVEKIHQKRHEFMQDLIGERRKNRANVDPGENMINRAKTMLDVLLSLQETEPGYYTDELINGLNQNILAGGAETSSGTLEWALSLLLNNPASLKTAQEEIDFKIGHSRLINDSDLEHLPYLSGVISETLRIYPAAPILLPRMSSEDCFVGGYRISRGTLLLVNIWGIQNDPKLWDECAKFKPERFMNLGGQRVDRSVYMPFGCGRRRCPGDNLATRVIALTLGSLLQCFNWEAAGDETHEMVDMTEEGSAFNMYKAKPLLAKCKPRPEMMKVLSQL